MTRKEVCDSMTLQDAIQVFRDTNAYGTMDIAKTVILEALEQQANKKKTDKEVKLSKPAFVVLDQLIKEHKDLYGNISFKTFCDGEHKRITTNQVNKELDALYDHYYKNKGGKDGKGTE